MTAPLPNLDPQGFFRRIKRFLRTIRPLLITLALWLIASGLVYVLVAFVELQFSYAIIIVCSLFVVVALALVSLIHIQIGR